MLVKYGNVPSVDCRGDSLSLALCPPDVEHIGNGRRLTKFEGKNDSEGERQWQM